MNIVTDVIALLVTPAAQDSQVAVSVDTDRAPPGAPSAAASCAIRRRQWLPSLGAAVRTPRGATGLGWPPSSCWSRSSARWWPRIRPTALLTLPVREASGQFLLGGDFLGRDVLSRVLDGGWLLLLMAVAATALGIVAGAAAGISAAYLRGRPTGSSCGPSTSSWPSRSWSSPCCC